MKFGLLVNRYTDDRIVDAQTYHVVDCEPDQLDEIMNSLLQDIHQAETIVYSRYRHFVVDSVNVLSQPLLHLHD